MKKLIVFIAAATLLAGCNTDKTVKPDALLHHRFELVQANGNAVDVGESGLRPYIEFGENFAINGKMCNSFVGQATYKEGELTSPGLASTKMLCADEQLNQLDNVIGQVLVNGAKVSMEGDKLTLKSSDNTLVYELKDVMN
ncbi:META domain-containing protein [Utexia brackfieldae]|uniref:META domain-containing protein n=1 Tax=Utexia brackfieldae TaxID=3074108 RepID=UPI00370D699A